MIIGIIGDLGQGKTLSAVYLALKMKRMGYTIISNMKNFALNDDIIDDPQKIQELNSKDKYLIILDEIYVYADSRNSMSKSNRLLSYLVFQSRKRNIDIIYTAQKISSVDIRIRGLTNIFINTINLGIVDNHIILKWELIKDISRNFEYTPVRTIRIKIPVKLFKLYDTYEIISFRDEKIPKRRLENE